MTCEEIGARIVAYLDGELDPEERAAVRSHLHECAECSAEADSLGATLDELPRWSESASEAVVAALAVEVRALRQRVSDLEREVRRLRAPSRSRLVPSPLIPDLGNGGSGLRLIG